MEQKLPAYAAAGIPEVWIVNLNDKWIDRYQTPGARLAMPATRTLMTGDELPVALWGHATLSVSAILAA